MSYYPSLSGSNPTDESYARNRFKFAKELNQLNNKQRVDLLLSDGSQEEIARLMKIGKLLLMDRDYWRDFLIRHYSTLHIKAEVEDMIRGEKEPV